MDEHEDYLAPCPYCGEVLDLTMKEYYARKEKYICKGCNTILIGENCGSKEVYIITEDEYIDNIKITFHCNNCNEELEVDFHTDVTNKDIICSCGKMFKVNKPKYPDCIGYGYTD